MEDQKNKRYKFSPSNVEQIEKETMDRLCGTEDRYRVPETFKGKEPSTWDMLHNQFPANSTLQDTAQLFMFQLNYRGCPLYYTCMQCECPNCTDMKQAYIPYAHSVMYDQELNAITTPGKVRQMPDIESYLVRPNDIDAAIGMVIHHAHYYAEYTVCSHSSALQSCPETPVSSRVLLRLDPSEDARMDSVIEKAKWATRVAMTPTKLIFK